MFSLPKLLLLAGVVVAVLYGYKLFSRLEHRRERLKRDEAPEGARPKRRVEAEDLVKCPICGTYFAAGSDHDCPDRAPRSDTRE